MPRPRLQAILTTEEDRTLLELRTATSVPQRTKDRAEVLCLSHRGWTTEKIAEYFDWRVETVRETIYRWRDQGLGGLWDAPRPGCRPRCQEADIAHLEQSLQQEAQNHNAKQLVHHMSKSSKSRIDGYDPVIDCHHLIFENRCLPASGDDFQSLFEAIMVGARPEEFERVRLYGKYGDRKCDGLIESEGIIFQVYSPDELKQSDVQKKIDEDLEGAVQHWRNILKK